jgi:type IV pilus assembly protein PilC
MAVATKTAARPAARALPKRQGSELQTFTWVGKDKRGTVMKGEQLAKNANLLKAELRRQGITPGTVKPKAKPLFGKAGSSISAKDIAMFSRQIATMMKSGVPVVQSFEIIAGGQTNPRMKAMLEDIKSNIESGSTLYEALSKHPDQFDELYCNLVRAGEGAGVLDTVLDTIATYKENTEALKSKIKKALLYPSIVIFVAGMVSALLLMFVVPQFEQVFKSFGADLPAFTQLVVGMSRWMVAYWWLVLIIVVGSGVALFQANKRSYAFARFKDRLLLRLPIIGPIMHNAAIARFARTLATTFKAGVPLVEAMETVAGATGNIVYTEAVNKVRQDVAVGYPLNTAMRQVNLFPHMVLQMTAIGEEAGALDTMLFKIAEFYEAEVNNAVDNLSTLIEPLVMVVIGVIVGSLVIAMYLPIFKIAATV